MEIRLKDVNLEYDNDAKRIGGYINVVERSSEVMYSHKDCKWFKETMQSGVFKRALQKNQSIPLLLEHDWDKQVAHTNDGTLELREDSIGLRFDAVVSEETYKEIEKKGITSCSFGFKINEQQKEPINKKLEKRYVTNIDLFEVSLVSNPAYVGSLVEKRALEDALKEEEVEQLRAKEEKEEKNSENSKKDEKLSKDKKSEHEDEESEEKEEKNSENSKKDEKLSKDKKSEHEDEESEEIDEDKSKDDKESEGECEDDDKDDEKRSTEDAVVIDAIDSDKKEEIREVIESAIVEGESDAQMYGDIVQSIDLEKQMVLEDTQNIVKDLEKKSIHYSYLAQKKWLEVAKLKQLSMSL